MPTGQSDLFVRLRFVVQEPFETATGPFGQPEGFGSLSEPIFPGQKLPVSGSPTVFVDNGQGLIRTHDGFLVRDIGLFGMSGGPVFDTNATILGIQGSVTAPRVSTNGIRQISVENAAVIRSNLILEFLKTRRVRLN